MDLVKKLLAKNLHDFIATTFLLLDIETLRNCMVVSQDWNSFIVTYLCSSKHYKEKILLRAWDEFSPSMKIIVSKYSICDITSDEDDGCSAAISYYNGNMDIIDTDGNIEECNTNYPDSIRQEYNITSSKSLLNNHILVTACHGSNNQQNCAFFVNVRQRSNLKLMYKEEIENSKTFTSIDISKNVIMIRYLTFLCISKIILCTRRYGSDLLKNDQSLFLEMDQISSS